MSVPRPPRGYKWCACGALKGFKSAACARCALVARTPDPDQARANQFIANANAAIRRRGYAGGQMPMDTPLPTGPCHYCGAAATSWDHVQPLALGGANVVENLVPACLLCNQRKGKRQTGDMPPLVTTLRCDWCTQPFERRTSDVARAARLGRLKAYCSLDHRNRGHARYMRGRNDGRHRVAH